MGFAEALELQLQLRDECIRDPARASLLMVEHPPTISIGLKGDREDVVAAPGRLAQLGVEVVETNRGGEVTLHAPGQLVVYPIISLAERGRSLHRYLRDLETWLVAVCRSCGVPAHPRSPHTGVWVEDRKIASIGIAARRWVTYHGVALNVSTDMSLFDLIVPCGLKDAAMTSLERELGAAPPMVEVAARAADAFAERFRMVLEDAGREALGMR
jgi:lipoate-protein ligase B